MEEKRLDRLEKKIDVLVDGQGEVNVHLAEIRKDLHYHIKRTDILEHKVLPIWTTFKALTLLGGLAVTITALLEIINFIRH